MGATSCLFCDLVDGKTPLIATDLLDVTRFLVLQSAGNSCKRLQHNTANDNDSRHRRAIHNAGRRFLCFNRFSGAVAHHPWSITTGRSHIGTSMSAVLCLRAPVSRCSAHMLECSTCFKSTVAAACKQAGRCPFGVAIC